VSAPQTPFAFSADAIRQEKLSRFNPLSDLSPQTLVTRIDQFRAGHVRHFARTADAMEETDDVLACVIPKAKSAVARRGWEILTVENDQPELAERQQDVLQRFYDTLRATSALDADEAGGFQLLLRQMMDAKGKRYAVHNLVWRPVADSYQVTAHFCPLWFFENTTGRMRFLRERGQMYGETMEPGAWLVTKGTGIMLACAVAWMFKHLPLKDWLTYSGLFGMPGIEGVTDAGRDTEEWAAVEAVVAAAASGLKYVRNRSSEINRIEFGSTGDLPFPALVERMDRALASLWRGADLSTISAGQGQGQGASLQGDEASLMEADDCAWLSETLNHKLDRLVLDYVFGPEAPALAYVRVTGPDRRNLTQEIAVDTFLRDSRFPIAHQSVSERYGRPLPEGADPEALLQAPAPGPGLGMGNGQSGMGESEISNRQSAIVEEYADPESALNALLALPDEALPGAVDAWLAASVPAPSGASGSSGGVSRQPPAPKAPYKPTADFRAGSYKTIS
jgi:hypothetical protein